MCEPATIAMAVVAAAGSAMQAQAQNKAADKQQSAINDALEVQDNYSRQAESKALENASQYDAKERLTDYADTSAKAGESLAQQLTQAREAAPQTAQASGRMSQEFLTGDASAKADQFEKSINMAQLMGKMRGSSDMLTNEGYQNADYASQLGLIGRNAQRSATAAQPGIASAGKVNGGQMALGGAMSSIGSSYAGSGMGEALNGMFSTKLKPGQNLVMGGV